MSGDEMRPFWIVMALDKPGPCERGERPYRRHESKARALAEARRLALSEVGAGRRFAVLALMHVVGWVDVAIDFDDPIPF